MGASGDELYHQATRWSRAEPEKLELQLSCDNFATPAFSCWNKWGMAWTSKLQTHRLWQRSTMVAWVGENCLFDVGLGLNGLWPELVKVVPPQLKLTTSQLVDFSSSIRNLKWKQKKLSTMEAGMRALLLLVSLRVRRESSLHLSLRDLRVKEGSLHQSFWKHFDKV